jgi:hypothetical protein
MDSFFWRSSWDTLLEEARERGTNAQKHDDPQHGHDKRQGQAAQSHQQVKEQNINDDRSEQGQGEGDVAIDQEQDRGNELEQKYDDQIVGDKERPDELAGGSGWHGRGNEVKEAVQSENEKDEAKKETGDDRSDFHVSIFCLR